MAVASQVLLSISKTGDTMVAETVSNYPINNADAPINVTTQLFAAATFAAVSIPALQGSAAIQGVLIEPPSSNTGTITLKGVTGDTGIDLHKTKPSFVSLNSTTNIGLLCASATTIKFIWV
jgi:hypothetical protein